MNLKSLQVPSLLGLTMAGLFAASSALHAAPKVICVPWQGNPAKYHTALVMECAGSKPAPASITFEIIDTCGGGFSWEFFLNGVKLGDATFSYDCDCYPAVKAFVANNAAAIAAAWNGSGGNMLRATLVSGGTYLSKVRAKIDYGGGNQTQVCIATPGGGDCFDNNFCAGYQWFSGSVEGSTDATTGTPARLKGVIKTSTTAQIWYKWVFGDGTESAVQTLSGQTKYNVEAEHQYCGSAGTPFTAQLMVSDVDNTLAGAVSDPYLVKLETDNLDARINIAIDNGLWYVYKAGVMSSGTSGSYLTSDGSPCVVWNYSTYFASPTASAVQAFEINGHKETGNFDEDPYAEYVKGGLAWLLRGSYGGSPMLQAVGMSLQHGTDDPDSNANGIGIEARDYSYNPCYETGQVMDALIASGTPNASSGRDFNGDGIVDSYKDILQDMCDMYALGQSDYNYGSGYIGGWRYGWNADSDNSASQWAAIGLIPAQQLPWNCTVPQWVKTYNNNWLNYSYNGSGFGYTDPSEWSPAQRPSGMVQLGFVGATTSDTRWVNSENWLASNWDSWRNQATGGGGYYGVYAIYACAKAMRLANPAPVVTFASNGFDWYRGTAASAGLAEAVSQKLIATSTYNDYWAGVNLGTAWAVIILKPVLFAEAPIACFTVHPNPTFPNLPIAFDPNCSGHSEPGKGIANLTKFEWDWNNDGVFDQSTTTPSVVTHAFACASLPCTYPVMLKVTDDSSPARTATYVVDVRITEPPHPPVSRPGGPYIVSLCAGDTLTVDGSASLDPDEGLHEAGCPTCPNDTITAWDWDLTGAPFNYTDGSGEMVALGTGFTSYFPTLGNYNIGLRVTDNTALAYPSSGQGNLKDEGFAEVTVYAGCGCDLKAVAYCSEVTLTWGAVAGASSYHVYYSTSDPNSGFSDILSTAQTTAVVANVPMDKALFFRILVVKADGSTCMSKAVLVVSESSKCCVKDLSARPKSGKIQLVWTSTGAHHYNIYRGTIAGGPYLKIAATTSTYSTYLDQTVANNVKYYYVVREAKQDDTETCQSNEASATASLRR